MAISRTLGRTREEKHTHKTPETKAEDSVYWATAATAARPKNKNDIPLETVGSDFTIF